MVKANPKCERTKETDVLDIRNNQVFNHLSVWCLYYFSFLRFNRCFVACLSHFTCFFFFHSHSLALFSSLVFSRRVAPFCVSLCCRSLWCACSLLLYSQIVVVILQHSLFKLFFFCISLYYRQNHICINVMSFAQHVRDES